MQKTLTGFALLSTLFGGFTWAAFNDVSSNHPHAEAIDYVEDQGIVGGYEDGTFRPDGLINRVELLKILVEAQPSPSDSCGVSARYNDTDNTSWYQTYLEAAACRGIASGYSDQSFRPGNPVLAVEAFKMITKAFSYALSNAEGEWYMPYLETLATKRAIPRTVEAPDSQLTRGQMAEMIYRLQYGTEPSQTSHTAQTLLAKSSQVIEAAKSAGINFDYVSQGGSTLEITEDETYRYIKSNGLPNHDTGQFPNSGNPNTISEQDTSYRVPLNPVYTETSTPVRRLGVALNGIFFEPGTAETYNNDIDWRIEAIQGGKRALGLDYNYAHVQPTGAYHYHAVPIELIEQLAGQNSQDQLLLGYAADGHGIYYSQTTVYQPSYRLKTGERPDGPGGEYDGTYTADYEYIEGLGDLDDCNGRFVNGEYRYFLTDQYPYQPRCLHGTADSSFGQGGRAGGPGQQRPVNRGDLLPPDQTLGLPDNRIMPHEICQQMSATFDPVVHNCPILLSDSNQALCQMGGGQVTGSTCQFTPPPGR